MVPKNSIAWNRLKIATQLAYVCPIMGKVSPDFIKNLGFLNKFPFLVKKSHRCDFDQIWWDGAPMCARAWEQVSRSLHNLCALRSGCKFVWGPPKNRPPWISLKLAGMVALVVPTHNPEHRRLLTTWESRIMGASLYENGPSCSNALSSDDALADKWPPYPWAHGGIKGKCQLTSMTSENL